MTREEQIQQAEINYSDDTIFDGCDYIGQVAKQEAFIAGTKWADSNPQFSKEKFIDKVCEWLRNNIDFYVETNYGEDFWVNMEQLLKDIRKAMEE